MGCNCVSYMLKSYTLKNAIIKQFYLKLEAACICVFVGIDVGLVLKMKTQLGWISVRQSVMHTRKQLLFFLLRCIQNRSAVCPNVFSVQLSVTYEGVSKIFRTDAVKIINLITKRPWNLPTSTQQRATWHTDSLNMVVLPTTCALRYHNCCIDGGTSPEYFWYTLVCNQ
jgi:hypothetical protein